MAKRKSVSAVGESPSAKSPPRFRLFDCQLRREANGASDIVEVGRCRQDHIVDLAELLLCSVSLDHYRSAQLAIAGCDSRIEPKEAAQVDLAFGCDLQLLQYDALQCA